MKKQIEIDFPEDFSPPDKFEFGHGCSQNDFSCPFYQCSDLDAWCAIAGDNEDCPIKRYFKEEIL